MKIAVLWSRFGPYHVARLRGAAEVAASMGATIVGIEVASRDSVYAWDEVGRSEGFERITLFRGQSYGDVAARQIARELVAALDRIAPDVVAVNGWSVAEARAAIRWCRGGRRARAIVMSETKADDAPRSWWKELAKRRILAGCTAALVGGRAHADYLAGLGMPRAAIRLGYDTVDNEHFAAGALAAQSDAVSHRTRLGLPERYFFACTRFIARKNVDGLLKAYATYRRQAEGQPWGLVIAGSGAQQPVYDALVRDLGIEGVVWPGFVQYGELPLYYGLASAFVHAAHQEAWGLVVNEALAAGLPVVVSRTVGARHELVADGGNGYLFDPSSPAELADCLARLAALPVEARRTMRRAAEATAAQWTQKRFGTGLLAAAGLEGERRARGRRSQPAGVAPKGAQSHMGGQA